MSDSDITYLDILSLQTVVQFKWETYTKNQFIARFRKLLIFIVALLSDLLLGKILENQNAKDINFITSKSVCSLVIIYFAQYELRQIRANYKGYFSSYWNIFDLLLIIVYSSYIPVSIFYGADISTLIKSL